ncbi:hypothetical protein GCM10023149_32850 [Mucilaginibacter gynuensis]|uniref:LiaI-LiaF-like transmembrane region domain-containing protein n=1 Tax=Mucilaginibacter gynuensis TaxID=1302236 RepID=A0ABP8GQZ9_9SPHI
MRSDKIIPGLVLVLIGGAFLLHNLGYIDFHWGNLFRLWPVFLVIAGVNLVLSNTRAPWAIGVKVLVVLLGFGLIIFANPGRGYHFWGPFKYHYDYSDSNHDNDNDDDDDDDNDTVTAGKGIVKVEGKSAFNEPFVADTRYARLNVNGGGTVYKLSDTTAQLFHADTKEVMGRYEFSSTKEDSVAVLDFRMRSKKGHINWSSDNSNVATFRLNPNPVWDINVKTGATELDFDLTKFKVRSVTLNGGAASLTVKLGQPLELTSVEVSTGVSEVNISVPQNAACSITSSSGLSSTHFDGFKKIKDNYYETPGYAAAKNKIHIKMSGGISEFNVKRY